MLSRFQLFMIGALVVLTVGLVTLGVYLVNIVQTLATLQKPAFSTTARPDFNAVIDLAEQQETSLSALLARVEDLENTQVQPTPKITPSLMSAAFQKQVIYLGSANSLSREWANSGVEVILDSTDYPANVVAVFEAGLSIVGGEAWARVTNKTTGAVISASEVAHGSNTTTWKSSAAFKLHAGKNIYVVQMRSTSGETANLAGARLVISQ